MACFWGLLVQCCGVCSHTHCMCCRPVMSFVMSFTRLPRVTQIVGARGFIKGASEVSHPSTRYSIGCQSTAATSFLCWTSCGLQCLVLGCHCFTVVLTVAVADADVAVMMLPLLLSYWCWCWCWCDDVAVAAAAAVITVLLLL